MDPYLATVHKIAIDPEFRALFAADPHTALENEGLVLSEEQIAALTEIMALPHKHLASRGPVPNSWGGGGWGRFAYEDLTHPAIGTP